MDVVPYSVRAHDAILGDVLADALPTLPTDVVALIVPYVAKCHADDIPCERDIVAVCDGCGEGACSRHRFEVVTAHEYVLLRTLTRLCYQCQTTGCHQCGRPWPPLVFFRICACCNARLCPPCTLRVADWYPEQMDEHSPLLNVCRACATCRRCGRVGHLTKWCPSRKRKHMDD